MEKQSKYANYTYDKDDEVLVNVIDDYLNEQAEDIYDFFGNSLSRKKVNTIVFNTKKGFDDYIKKITKREEVPGWNVGYTSSLGICIVSLNDYKNTSHAFKDEEYDNKLEEYKKMFAHEFVHYVHFSYDLEKGEQHNLGYIYYTKEGIAQILSGQRKDEELSFNYSLDEIKNNPKCYKGWYVLSKYIMDNYDKDYYLDLLCNDDLANKELPRLYEETKNYYKNKKER